MKTTDFLKEGIGEDAHDMHKDHEVQMARQECYGAARDAIALHTLLKNISEMQGLEGWVSEKITLAADYLKTVHDYLEYEMMSKHEALPSFNMESADAALGAALSETNDYFKRRKDEEDRIAGTKPAKTRQQQQTDYMKRRKGEEDRIAGAKTAKKKTPVVIQTDKPIGVRVADIGPGGREYNVTTDKEWDKQKGVAEDADDTVGFSVETERAYQAVMDKYGDYIEHKESGIMYVPRRLWGRVEEVAYEADGIGATEDNGYENLEHYSVAEDALDEVKAKEIMPNGNGAGDDPRIKLRRIKNKMKEYEDLIKQHSDGITDRVADIIAKRDRLVNQKEKLEKAGVKEDASAGASSAGAVATVAAPLMKKPIKRKMR